MYFKSIIGCLFLFVVSTTVSVAQFDNDFFWSDKGLHEGAMNQDLVIEVEVGDVVPLYLYWTTNGPVDSDISVGCAVDCSTTETGIIRFDSAETLEYDVIIVGFPDNPIGSRWQSSDGNGGYGGGGLAGPAYMVTPDFIDLLWAFTVGNFGILEQHNGSSIFLDEGYDTDADAFLFGQMSFTALAAGKVQIITVTDESGCVDGADLIEPVHSTVTVIVNQSLTLGDVNLDGDVNLLDVGPFVQILSDLRYQAEADINQDGSVDLLDVPLFVDLLSP